ncbi:MAG: hypothetical protein JW751_13800 [Polyangiaceae bacterium]|nr:hypothetical protein [Polyangiaceae bacterium]
MTTPIRSVRTPRVTASVCLAASAIPGVAWAAEPGISAGPTLLGVERTSAAADCPTAEALSEMVNRVAHTPSVVPTKPGEMPGVAVTLDRDAGGYRARIEAFEPVAGVRVITDPGPSCAALAGALSVTVALLLDETRSERKEPVAFPPEPTPDTAERPPLTRGPPALVSGGSPAHLGAEAGWGVAMGITFDVAPATWFGGRVTSDRWSAHAQALLIPRLERDVGSIRLYLGPWWGGRGRVCRTLWSSDGAWPAGGVCIEAALGTLKARAENVLRPRSARPTWLGLGGGVDLTGRILGPVDWRFSMTALGPVVDERFEVEGEEEELVHDPPRLAGLAGLTLGASIW